MARPSRHLDRTLIAAGRRLLAGTGLAGLSIRLVCREADVNTGMFHYHFKTRETFLRAVLQATYEEMFAAFSLQVGHPGLPPVERLRAAFRVLGRFLRDHRPMVARVFSEALAGEALAREFMATNLPRHLGILGQLLGEAQAAGALARLPIPQALGLIAGGIAFPILMGGEIASESGPARKVGASLLTDAAIDQRIDLALAALAAKGGGP